MPILDSGAVRTGDCVVMWDGLSRPEPVAATGDKPAGTKYTLKLAFAPDSPTYAELYHVSDAFTKSKYPSGAPRGFEGAFRPAEVPELPGYISVNAATFNGLPEVFDKSGRVLTQAELAGLLYAGAKVQAVLTPRVFDAAGNRGAGFWLGGVLVVDSTAPRLSIAAGMSQADVRNAFGLPSSPLAGSAAPAPAPGVAPAPGIPPAPGVAAAAPPAMPGTASSPPPPVPAGPASSATTSPSSVAVAPNYGMLNPPAPPGAAPTPPAAPAGPTMTPAALSQGYTYEMLKGAGWTDEQMIQGGYLTPQ